MRFINCHPGQPGYSSLNSRRRLSLTFTEKPCCLNGRQSGILFTTLTTSALHPSPASRSTAVSLVFPRFSMTKEMTAMPLLIFHMAIVTTGLLMAQQTSASFNLNEKRR